MARDIEFPTKLVKYSRRIGGVICKHLKFQGFFVTLSRRKPEFIASDNPLGKQGIHA
jgi:hypothetical protein